MPSTGRGSACTSGRCTRTRAAPLRTSTVYPHVAVPPLHYHHAMLMPSPALLSGDPASSLTAAVVLCAVACAWIAASVLMSRPCAFFARLRHVMSRRPTGKVDLMAADELLALCQARAVDVQPMVLLGASPRCRECRASAVVDAIVAPFTWWRQWQAVSALLQEEHTLVDIQSPCKVSEPPGTVEGFGWRRDRPS